MLSGRTVSVRKSVLLRYGLAILIGAAALAALGWFLWSDARSGPSDAEVAAILQTQLGGETTVKSTNRNSFALAAANLNSQERLTFEIGDSFFTQNWVTAPASTEARDGLGPTFNAQSCSSCHTLDGRAQPPGIRDPGRAGPNRGSDNIVFTISENRRRLPAPPRALPPIPRTDGGLSVSRPGAALRAFGPRAAGIPAAGPRAWWRRSGSNRRPPACKAGALPAELRPLPSAAAGSFRRSAAARRNGGPG